MSACCTIPPVKSDYSPKGEIFQIEDMDVYTVGPKGTKTAILVIYDIFGFHPNTKQFADRLAEHSKVNVIMPDFFRGKPFTEQDLADKEKLMSWVQSAGSIKGMMPDLAKCKNFLQQDGAVSAGVVGFCWGAKIASQATAEDSFWGAAALIHPSFPAKEDAEKAGGPMLVIPTKDEPDMTEYMNALKAKPFGDKCKHERFDDVHHGFAAARGDWSDETQAKRATQAIDLTSKFFNEHLKA
ncbi:hypothetical protein BZG36_05067 [Bifiguratus adelaidae]|uniref:Dienelactone hydrolase domain-containing protein n=1 Tax=Bifiguratus adelaidae TaxID=1938954 RepID=A0A261XVA5_9FUNG|nr:hypothetical protein BZG36_05067 [Bifiguratus adelaidae]